MSKPAPPKTRDKLPHKKKKDEEEDEADEPLPLLAAPEVAPEGPRAVGFSPAHGRAVTVPLGSAAPLRSGSSWFGSSETM